MFPSQQASPSGLVPCGNSMMMLLKSCLMLVILHCHASSDHQPQHCCIQSILKWWNTIRRLAKTRCIKHWRSSYLVSLQEIKPCLLLLRSLGSQVPNTVADTDIKTTFVKLMGLKSTKEILCGAEICTKKYINNGKQDTYLYNSLLNADGTPAAISCIMLRLVVRHHSIFYHSVTVLPTMNVVCPLAQLTTHFLTDGTLVGGDADLDVAVIVTQI